MYVVIDIVRNTVYTTFRTRNYDEETKLLKQQRYA
jgi:hypothetical protein